MRLFSTKSLALVLVGMMFTACSVRHELTEVVETQKPAAAIEKKNLKLPVSKGDAVDLAIGELTRVGGKPEEWNMEVETSPDGNKWLVAFELKVRKSLGGFMVVFIEKNTGKVVLRGGS